MHFGFNTKLIIHYSVLRIPVVETVVVVAAVVVAETKERNKDIAYQ